MAASTLLHPESRCQERYLTDQVAIYKRYAELVRREMDIKQSQVKKRYYQVFVKPNARRQQSGANELEAAPTSQLLSAAAPRTHSGAIGTASRRPKRPPPLPAPPPPRRRGATDTAQPLAVSLPSSIALPPRKAPRLLSQSAAAAVDPLSSRVSALSLYTITARSRLRATRSTSRRGRRCGGGGGDGGDHDEGFHDDDSDGGGSVASASDFPALVYCIRRRLAKEASQQRRLAARNTALRRAQSAALEQNPLFAEEQCWRKGPDGVIRRRAIENHLPSRHGAAAVEEAAITARPGEVGRSRGGRMQVSRDGGGAATFLTELPRLPTTTTATATRRPPQQQQKWRRDRLGASRAAFEPIRPLIGSVA